MDNNTNQNVNQNVNQTATPEIKTEEVATNKKEKKPKEKKVKEQKPAMDKEDEKWYALALLFLIISLVPYLSRIMDPNYDEFKYADKDKDKDKPVEIVTKTLNCRKTIEQPEYSYLIEVTSSYENNKPVNTNIRYTVTLASGSSKDVESIEIEEYLTIESLTESGVTTSAEDKTKSPEGYDQKVYNASLNFRLNQGLLSRSEVDDHNKDYAIQKNNYTQKGYQCANS